ncbi:hypothetical protein MTO96_021929 [Rhipicephalus appendiculatus]
MIVDVCPEEDKESKLSELLNDVLKEKTDRAMVFADTKWKVEEIAFKLRTQGWPAISLHGRKEKKERDWVLSMFTSGGESVLVTTDMVRSGPRLAARAACGELRLPGLLESVRAQVETRPSSPTSRARCTRSLFLPNMCRPRP